MLVDDDGGGRVQRLDVDEAEAKARFGDEPFEAIGQIDELGRMCGREADSVCRQAEAGASVSIEVLLREASAAARREVFSER